MYYFLEAKNCTGLQFQCKIDGKCIHSSQLCDGVAHCTDGSDEDNEKCKSKFFFVSFFFKLVQPMNAVKTLKDSLLILTGTY